MQLTKLIGRVGAVLGAFFLACGIAAYGFTLPTGLNEYPLRQYSGNLLFLGIFLLLVGIVFMWRTKQDTTEQKTSSEIPKPPEN